MRQVRLVTSLARAVEELLNSVHLTWPESWKESLRTATRWQVMEL